MLLLLNKKRLTNRCLLLLQNTELDGNLDRRDVALQFLISIKVNHSRAMNMCSEQSSRQEQAFHPRTYDIGVVNHKLLA